MQLIKFLFSISWTRIVAVFVSGLICGVANTYLLYLRFQMMRCAYTVERYAEECALLRGVLEKRPEPHWQKFLSLWKT